MALSPGTLLIAIIALPFAGSCVAMLFRTNARNAEAYLAGLVVATSGWWQAHAPMADSRGRQMVRLAWMTAGLAYGQLILGALVRHVPLSASPQLFRAALVLHLAGAVALALQIALLAWSALRRRADLPRGLAAPVVLLPVLLYPITIPVIIAGVRGTSELFRPAADEPLVRMLIAVLVFFDVVFVTLSLWTFEPLMME